jgi:inosine/xanthosine triphosphate pyrophosphatase family protein
LIAPEARGLAGFGYDSVFIDDQQTLTNAERLDAGEPTQRVKLHRQRAVAALFAALHQGAA